MQRPSSLVTKEGRRDLKTPPPPPPPPAQCGWGEKGNCVWEKPASFSVSTTCRDREDRSSPPPAPE